MNTFKLHILAADKPYYEGECEYISVPTVDGLLGVMANHANTIASIIPGTITMRVPNEQDSVAAVSNGLIKIEDNEVLVLVDTIERPEEIDFRRAERDAAEAKEALLQKKSIMDFRQAQAKMARAVNRLKFKGRQ